MQEYGSAHRESMKLIGEVAVCQFVIRRVYEYELEQCIDMLREAFGTVAMQFHITKKSCPTNPAFIEAIHLLADYGKGNLMYVLISGEKIVGFMQLECGKPARYKLKNVAVASGHRHKGYGKELLKFAKTKVLELGGGVIEIGIIEENTVLKEWYINNEFIHMGTKKFDHLPFTVGFMECAIDEQSQV